MPQHLPPRNPRQTPPPTATGQQAEAGVASERVAGAKVVVEGGGAEVLSGRRRAEARAQGEEAGEGVPLGGVLREDLGRGVLRGVSGRGDPREGLAGAEEAAEVGGGGAGDVMVAVAGGGGGGGIVAAEVAGGGVGEEEGGGEGKTISNVDWERYRRMAG